MYVALTVASALDDVVAFTTKESEVMLDTEAPEHKEYTMPESVTVGDVSLLVTLLKIVPTAKGCAPFTYLAR